MFFAVYTKALLALILYIYNIQSYLASFVFHVVLSTAVLALHEIKASTSLKKPHSKLHLVYLVSASKTLYFFCVPFIYFFQETRKKEEGGKEGEERSKEVPRARSAYLKGLEAE